MEKYIRLSDTLSANEGKVSIRIGDKNRDLFEVMKVSVNIEKDIIEKKMLGNKITQHKVVGAKISGSATLALMSKELLEATNAYIKTGQYPDITLIITNEDKASTVGGRSVYLYGVIFKTDLISMLDSGSEDPVTYDTDFTADSFVIEKDFDLPQNYR